VRQHDDEARAAAALRALHESLDRTDPLVAPNPGLRDVITLLRAHEEAERQLCIQRLQPEAPVAPALEQGLVHAFLVLSRPPLDDLVELAGQALDGLRTVVARHRYFLCLSLLVFGTAFVVGLTAVDADSRFGDLLLLESSSATNLAGARDPVGALLLMGLGRQTGTYFLGELSRLLLLYGLFVGGLALGVPPVTALSVQGARLGSLAAAGAFDRPGSLRVLFDGMPDFAATLFVASAGLVVAYRLLATGELTWRHAVARGLRDGAGLFAAGCLFHALTILPFAEVRTLATVLLMAAVLYPPARKDVR